jgi:hypothetical protein
MLHEVSHGFVRKVAATTLILTVDGHRKQRKTGTNDLEAAIEMIA